LRLVWQASRGWTLAWAILLALQGLLPAALVYFTRPFIDSLVPIVNGSGSWENVSFTLFLAGLIVAAILLTQILQSVNNWVSAAQGQSIGDYLANLIHAKATAVDLAFYEFPEYHDRLTRARQDAGTRPLALLNSVGSLLQNGITIVALVMMLTPYGWWIPLVLVVSALPLFAVIYLFNQRYHQWWERTTADRRWSEYYSTLLTHVLPAAELRLFNLSPFFQSTYRQLRQVLRTESLKLTRDQSVAQLVSSLFSLLVVGAVMAWMLARVVQGAATLGDLALFYQTFNRGQTLLNSLMNNLGGVYSNTLYLGNLFEFLNQQPQIVSPAQPAPTPARLQTGISFNNIAFRYPGSTRWALKDFSLMIPAGQTVAIVGANGAGKTTLLKLLCRFYDPEAGQIELDGVDIRRLAVDDLRRAITVLFQTPVTYHATAIHNITYGDFSAEPRLADVETAARRAGAHEVIERLPQGYNTLLGKAYTGGTELSGGEWQRVALARAFFRQAHIMILDEPTSALDSWSEADWYDRFSQLASGRTSIIITHRLTIARRADMIHVMDNGEIIESGAHDALIAANGIYAQSWRAQIESARTTGFAAENVETGANGNSPGSKIAGSWPHPIEDAGSNSTWS